MGQKVNPIAFRLAVNKDWRSKWYASGKDYTDKLHEDLSIRGYLKRKLFHACMKLALRVGTRILDGESVNAWDRLRYAIGNALIGPALGAMLLAATDKGICRLSFDEDETALATRAPVLAWRG